MADFISREKEFRKLNEKLDDEYKKSTNGKNDKTSEISGQRKSPVNGHINHNNNKNHNIHDNDTFRIATMVSDRFATYTKPRAPTLNVLKKNGAGDCVSPPKSPTMTNRVPKERYGNGINQQRLVKSLPRSHGVGHIFVTKATNERKANAERSDEETSRSNNTGRRQHHHHHHNNTNKHHNHHHHHQQQQHQSFSTRRLNHSDPVVVKYRNEKFSCSPSLDNMIKEDLEMLAEARSEERMGGSIDGRNETLEAINNGGKPIQKFVNTSGLIRYLKSKVSLLEENQMRTMQEMVQQREAFEQANERNKLVQQQRDKALLRNTALSEQLEKMASQLNDANRRCREQSHEALAQQKELETLKREVKQLGLANGNLEKRFVRAKEELESALKSYASLRENERELKENLRREADTKVSEIKYLKKQRSDLLTAYKKQLFLIDNLRQQNICMEQSKMIDFVEKDFSKVLEWNLKP